MKYVTLILMATVCLAASQEALDKAKQAYSLEMQGKKTEAVEAYVQAAKLNDATTIDAFTERLIARWSVLDQQAANYYKRSFSATNEDERKLCLQYAFKEEEKETEEKMLQGVLLYNSHVYKLFEEPVPFYSDAKKFCENRYGSIVFYDNEDERKATAEYVKKARKNKEWQVLWDGHEAYKKGNFKIKAFVCEWNSKEDYLKFFELNQKQAQSPAVTTPISSQTTKEQMPAIEVPKVNKIENAMDAYTQVMKVDPVKEPRQISKALELIIALREECPEFVSHHVSELDKKEISLLKGGIRYAELFEKDSTAMKKRLEEMNQ